MPGTHHVCGDSWTILLPDGWKAPERCENGTIYIDAVDESKGIYVTTWVLPSQEGSTGAVAEAESFKDKDVQTIESMEGFAWRLVDERVEEPEMDFAVVMADHLAAANEYRIVTKVIARPPLVVRAAFHDYNCDDYEASREYFAPLIAAFRLKPEATPPDGERATP